MTPGAGVRSAARRVEPPGVVKVIAPQVGRACWTCTARPRAPPLSTDRGEPGRVTEPVAGLPFSRAQMLSAGLTPDQVRHRVRTGRWVPLRRGWYVEAGTDPGPTGRVVAALGRVADGAVASHLSAAELHGLPLLRPPGAAVWLTSPDRGGPVARRGLVVAAAALRPDEVLELAGVRCTTLSRTAIDLARRWPLADAVTVLDAVLRRGTSREELWAAVLRADHWPGALRARRAVRLADGRSESPLESLSRVRLHQQRLPAPDLQVEVRAHGRRYRSDFGWAEAGVLGEADGLAKYADLQALVREKRRQADLEEQGFVLVRWTWSEIDRTPALVARRILSAFGRGRALRRAHT